MLAAIAETLTILRIISRIALTSASLIIRALAVTTLTLVGIAAFTVLTALAAVAALRVSVLRLTIVLLGILLIVTGLINSIIFVFGAAGGQIVQGALWCLIGWALYRTAPVAKNSLAE